MPYLTAVVISARYWPNPPSPLTDTTLRRVAAAQAPIAAGKPKPMTGLTGLWALVPLIGSIVWVIKVQGALNRYWDSASEAPAAAPAA